MRLLLLVLQGAQQELAAAQSERDAALAQLAEARREADALRAGTGKAARGSNGRAKVRQCLGFFFFSSLYCMLLAGGCRVSMTWCRGRGA
jgi:hypothetical protein